MWTGFVVARTAAHWAPVSCNPFLRHRRGVERFVASRHPTVAPPGQKTLAFSDPSSPSRATRQLPNSASTAAELPRRTPSSAKSPSIDSTIFRLMFKIRKKRVRSPPLFREFPCDHASLQPPATDYFIVPVGEVLAAISRERGEFPDVETSVLERVPVDSKKLELPGKSG